MKYSNGMRLYKSSIIDNKVKLTYSDIGVSFNEMISFISSSENTDIFDLDIAISLKRHYSKKGYLTDKQTKLLKKIYRKIKKEK